jgi:hypothetical protein
MTIVVGTKGALDFPTPENPPGSGGSSGALSPAGSNNPSAYAGILGSFTINGYAIGAGGGGLGTPGALLDLTQWGLSQIISQVNGLNAGPLAGVTASSAPPGALRLASPAGVPIVIAGASGVLKALGLTSGTYQQ